jgi:hypothetical protein
VVACVAAQGFAPPASGAEEVSVFVPNLEGPAGLSSSITTVLALQIWQTLRRTDAKGSGADFGKSAVKTFAVNQPPQSHRAAEALARDAGVLSQIVVWGTVQTFGDGGIVQAFLSVPDYPHLNDRYYADFRTRHEEEWTVRVALKDGEVAFRVDLPRRQVAFEPIVVPQQVIGKYSGIGSIELHDPNKPGRKIGSIGKTFVAVEQRGDSALVRSGNVTGIVQLPDISKNRSEIVDFVGGLVRVFRADWAGAIDSMALVQQNPHTPTDLLIDSHLYAAMARSKLGHPGHNEIQRAYDLNPYLARTAAYAIMERIALFQTMTQARASPGERRSMISQARQLIDRHRKLFVQDDPWINEVLKGLDKIEATFN